MRSYWLNILLICVIQIKESQQTLIFPTSSDSTNEYYTASTYAATGGDTTYFQFDTINCGSSSCHVDCDGDTACYQTQIDATVSDELNIHCPNHRSCEELELISSPTTTLNIYCDALKSCYKANIMANNTANVYISCNNDTTPSYSSSPCYDLKLKAPDASSLTVDCIGPYTCYQSYIYANRAGDVQMNINGDNAFYSSKLHANMLNKPLVMNCNGTSACQSAYIYAYSMTDTLSLTCDGNQACYSTFVEAADMTAALTVDCVSYYGCRNSRIKCPSTDECNIDCDAANSCDDIKITVPNHQYESINLFCNPSMSTSCYSADLICSSTSKSTALSYDSANGYFKCDSYDCCPIYEGTINCPPDIHCEVNCTSPNVCRKHYINATLSTSLTVDCEGSGCSGAKILCPIGDMAVCNISSGSGVKPLEYSVIETGIDNAMDSFVLDCATASSCDYAAVLLRSKSINDVSIHCGSTDSCKFTLFDIGSDIYSQQISSFSLSCTSWGCRYMNLEIDSSYIDTFVWDCVNTQSCYDSTTTLTNSDAVINSYQLSCTGSSSCSSMYFNTSIAVINELTMDCTSSLSCSPSFLMYAQIMDKANMNCKGTDSCDSINVNLISAASDANVDIQCVYASLTTVASSGTCYNSLWKFYGNTKENMTVYCHQYDCHSADFYGYDLMNVDIDCDTPYSCQSSIISMASVSQLDLSCTKQYSCDGAFVYCPYREAGSCKISCATADVYHTCYNMQIYVPDGYAFDYLSLTCPSEEVHPNSDGCAYLDVNCQESSKNQATFVYDTTAHQYQCQYSSSSYCCPFFQGTKTVCPEGEDCTVNCKTIDCKDIFIDGTKATSLNVDCGASYYCQNTLIHCPHSGCSIECSYGNACYLANIVYNGELADSGTVSVNCTEGYSCQSMIINAQYANEVYLGCYLHSGESQYSCYQTKLYAQYANNVDIDLGAQYPTYQAYLYTDNANTVTLRAVGESSFYNSYIYAVNAGSLTISCASDENYQACVSSYFYVSADTTLGCYGHGCHDNNYIYLGPHSASSLHVNVYSCGQCNSALDCIYRFYLYCDAYSTSYYDSYSGSDYNSGGWTYNYCNAGNLADANTVFSSTVVDPNCANPLTAIECADGEDCSINCNSYGYNCMDGIIDGSAANYLTINCGYSDYCQDVTIQCPIGGCMITCSNSYVCSGAYIIYSGTESSQLLGINGNVTIHCSESYGCTNMVIDADWATGVELNCISSENNYNDVCYTLTLNANNVKVAELNFRELRGGYSTYLYTRNADYVLVTAYGNNALYSSYLYAEFAGSVEFKCWSYAYSYACYSGYYYIPDDTTFNCFGHGCYQLGTVYSTADTSGLQIVNYGCDQCTYLSECIYYFYIYCSRYSENSYSYSEECYGSTTYSYNCGCGDIISRSIFSDTDNSAQCAYDVVNIDTNNEEEGCTDWSDCYMYCDDSNCNGAYIDGTNYNYLEVHCDGSYYCQNTVITCPNQGCKIYCKTSYSCQYIQIHYEGIQENYGTVGVSCAGAESCYEAKIYAEYAHTVQLNCTASEGLYDEVCFNLVLRAEYAWNVKLVGKNQYGFYSSKLHANNSKSVTLTARGAYAFYSSYLFASFVVNVAINCISDAYASAACSNSYWYLPSNATFKCHGPGCYTLGTIYTRYSAANFTFNINACEGCEGVENCLGPLTFYCGYPYYSYQEYYYGYDYDSFSSQRCYDPSLYYDYCGCEQVIAGISYSDNRKDQACFNAISVAAQIGAIIGWVIGGVCGFLLLCLLYRKCCRKRRYKNNKTFTVTPAKPTPIKPVTSISASPRLNTVPVTRYASNPVQTVVVSRNPTGQYTAVVGSNVTRLPPGSVGTTNSIQMMRVEPVNASAPPMSSAFDAADAETPPGASAPPPDYDNVDAAPPAYGNILGGSEGEGRVTNM